MSEGERPTCATAAPLMGGRAAGSIPGRARVGISRTRSLMGPTAQSSRTQRRGARDKGLICGGAHSYSHLYCQCVAVALIILVSLDYHIHVTFYLGNDGVMTR